MKLKTEFVNNGSFLKTVLTLVSITFIATHFSQSFATDLPEDPKQNICQTSLTIPGNAEVVLLIAADQSLKITEIQKQAATLGFHQVTLDQPSATNPFFRLSGTVGTASISQIESIDGVSSVGIGVLIVADMALSANEDDTPMRRNFISQLQAAGLHIFTFRYGIISGYTLNTASFQALKNVSGVEEVDFNYLQRKR